MYIVMRTCLDCHHSEVNVNGLFDMCGLKCLTMKACSSKARGLDSSPRALLRHKDTSITIYVLKVH